MDSGFMQKNQVIGRQGIVSYGEKGKCLIMKQKCARREDQTKELLPQDFSLGRGSVTVRRCYKPKCDLRLDKPFHISCLHQRRGFKEFLMHELG